MIGIVAVSHSARLGEAALELALQMVRGDGVRVVVAAGAGTDAHGAPILGTDAVAVAAAIDELAADCDGVLVLMDLGSAVLSAELATELRMSDVPVLLAPAPFVEGLLAAVVSAAAGGTLEQVAAEASAALLAKTEQLGESDDGPAPTDVAADAPEITRVVHVRNALGIHARPAALIAEATGGAAVRLRRLPDGPEASAASLSRLLTLGARRGDDIELTGSGEGAVDAVDRLVRLFGEGFGEGVETAPADTASVAPVAPSPPAPVVSAGDVLRGRGVSGGRAVGRVVHLGATAVEPDAETLVARADRDDEAAAIERAARAVVEQLRMRSERASGEASDILEAAVLLAADPDLLADAVDLVRSSGRTAARAVWEAATAQERALAALGGRTGERAVDVRDVRDRIVAELLGSNLPGVPDRAEPFVLVASDLAPADTAQLAGGGCIALVTEQGGPTSHTAIIARSLGLPAVVGVAGATGISDGAVVLVDGDAGTIDVEPTGERIASATATAAASELSGQGVLADGLRIALLANVGGGADARAAASARAEGVGLFRTEFCFLDRTEAPSVAEQVGAYREVLAAFPERRVVVRTLDAGSDKPLPFANADDEENPALGVRGLRIVRRSPALLADQLHALSLAAEAESARVEVMAPMVATLDEARDFSAQAREAGLPRVGVMIETPSAALLAAEMLDVVDFVSIGTNDLVQYTLAADRLLGELGDLNDPWQPAVLRLIGIVGEAGRAAGRPVGVCGEAAADPALAPVLVGLGVTSLSMAPRALGAVAASLADVTEEGCREMAEAARGAATAAEARAAASAVRGDY